jgi:initiation factor 1A
MGGKNKKGGKRKKRMANFETIVKYVKRSEGEEYALVTKLLGYGRVRVRMIVRRQDSEYRDLHNSILLGRIAGRLKKRRNYVNKGDIVLVGTRAYQREKVDIVYVYSERRNKQQLINDREINYSDTLLYDEEKSDLIKLNNLEDSNGFKFSNECQDEPSKPASEEIIFDDI